MVTQFNILFWISEVSPGVRREMADNSTVANGDEDADNEHMVGDDHTAMKRRMEIMEEQNALLRMRNAELEQKQRLAESAWAGNYKCDGCQRPGTELEGPRFHCMVCADNDFCITCYDGAEYHKTCRNHAMVILKSQQTIGAPATATRGYPGTGQHRNWEQLLTDAGAKNQRQSAGGISWDLSASAPRQDAVGNIGVNVGDAALTPDRTSVIAGGLLSRPHDALSTGVGANVGPIGLTGVGLVQPPRPQPLAGDPKMGFGPPRMPSLDLDAQKRDLLAMATCPVCNNRFYKQHGVHADKYTTSKQYTYKNKPGGALMSPTYGGYQSATVCSQACKDHFKQDDKRQYGFMC